MMAVRIENHLDVSLFFTQSNSKQSIRHRAYNLTHCLIWIFKLMAQVLLNL